MKGLRILVAEDCLLLRGRPEVRRTMKCSGGGGRSQNHYYSVLLAGSIVASGYWRWFIVAIPEYVFLSYWNVYFFTLIH